MMSWCLTAILIGDILREREREGGRENHAPHAIPRISNQYEFGWLDAGKMVMIYQFNDD